MEIVLIFPHQLFKHHPALKKGRSVWLIEEWLFFKQYRFSWHKLVFHRASMQFYFNWLRQQDYEVQYFETKGADLHIEELLLNTLTEPSKLHFADVVDDWLLQRIQKGASGHELIQYNNPGFINSLQTVKEYFEPKQSFFQTEFYIQQRKKLKILVEGKEKPIGGKWTFDGENRQRIPKNHTVPVPRFANKNVLIEEAENYVEQYFSNAYGSRLAPFKKGGYYPINFEDTALWLNDFIENRLLFFGTYEDALVANESILYHSVLTPMLNVGLLTPNEVLNTVLEKNKLVPIPLNSLEGFIRQIIGWREFIRGVYTVKGRFQRSHNYWKFTRNIPPQFWTGTTGILPVDNVIKKLLQTGYNHHIERLMILGNFMLLCEFKPTAVYQWFMEMYIDSYDWVMVPNVYGMTQFADGGIMTTKPYISGSNYILKMGNFEKGAWQEIWDGLFWRFMHVHRSFFQQNIRLKMLLNAFDKMLPSKKEQHLNNANQFLLQLDKWNLHA
jgi:deoxyribodipyrimidine photolyase-related protein